MRLLCLSLFLSGVASLLLSAPGVCCCQSRLPASRVAFSVNTCMCDNGEAAAAEPAVQEQDVPAEAVAGDESAREKKRGSKPTKTPIEELEVGMEVEGKIRSVMTYGAFVDVGAQTDALLHVSEISNEFIKDATEKLTAGEVVKGKIKAINLEKQQLAMTCKEPRERAPRKPRPDIAEYENADDKEFITGKVNSITDFGAFVTLKEGVDGLVHISQIQEGGVGKVSDVLSEGQEVQVRVTSVDKQKRRIGLSMLPWADPAETKEGSGRPMRGGGDVGFGEADKEFKMNDEELAEMAVGEFEGGAFEAAFARAKLVSEAKAQKKSYDKQVL